MGGANERKNITNVANVLGGGAAMAVTGKRGEIVKLKGEELTKDKNLLEIALDPKLHGEGIATMFEQSHKIISDLLGATDARADLKTAKGQQDWKTPEEDIRVAPSSAVSRFAQFQLKRKNKLEGDKAGREGLTIERNTDLGVTS